jgi:hypothetical protein
MAKTKKRTAGRKESAKSGKASVKPVRKKTAKRAMAEKPKSKVHRVTKRAKKPVAKEVAPLPEKSVEAAVVAAVAEPTSVLVLAETVQVTTSIASERQEVPSPAPDLDIRPEPKVA